jgi:hypothetical protein
MVDVETERNGHDKQMPTKAAECHVGQANPGVYFIFS